ncbi:MAG: PEP-utilizing enzyme [Myxococcales bacterium]|nr:PEP-utilizing enzyme [Myxococcales bacterium]MDD9966550.1 PEP-utilizing enzyme [Myxococcales bacterium]
MHPLIRPVDLILPRAAAAYGSKAANLAALARAGFPVPLTHAVSAEAAAEHYARALPPELLPHRLFAGRIVSEDDLREAHRRVLATAPAPDLAGAISAMVDQFRGSEVVSLVVRPSLLGQDLEPSAFVSLAVDCVAIQGAEAVLKAIRRCWAVLYAPETPGHLHHAQGSQPVGLGVMVQALVHAEASGAVFTVNPLTAEADEMVINAAYGLGTVLVDPCVAPDTYRVLKESGWVRDRVIGDKAAREDAAPGGGLQRRSVEASLRGRMCLDEHLLGELVAVCERVERHFGRPCDIEWSVVGDQLFVLRARPMLSVSSTRTKPSRRARPLLPDPVDLVWSNRHIGEAVAGVLTPLTWSVLRDFAEHGLQAALRNFGCTVSKQTRLVSNFRGRMYVNLTELSRIASQVPGLDPHTLLQLEPGPQRDRLERFVPRGVSKRFLMRLPTTVARLAREQGRLSKRVARFDEHYQAEVARLRAMDLRILPGVALDATLADVHRLLAETGAMFCTVHATLVVTTALLERVLAGEVGAEAPGLLNDLLAALDGLDTAAFGGEVLAAAAVAAHEPAARAAILGAGTFEGELSGLPGGPTATALAGLRAKFGNRALRDTELAEPRLRELPAGLHMMLRLHLCAGELAHHPRARGRARLQRAQARLARVRLPTRTATRGLLKLARHLLRLRERLRERVADGFALLRWIALDADRRLSVREPECGPGAVFYLTLPELHGLLGGDVPGVAAAVVRRRRQFARDCALPRPPDTFVGYPRPIAAPDGRPRTLTGVPASGGQVEGRVCVLEDPRHLADMRPGDVLVVPTGEAGWSMLLLVAAAVIIDAGGPLSHTCVVAREHGVPVVVGLKDATRSLRTGDRVRVDGSTGQVQVF